MPSNPGWQGTPAEAVSSPIALRYGSAMNWWIRIIKAGVGSVLVAAMLFACDGPVSDGGDGVSKNDLESLTIESASGKHAFSIEVARTPEQQMKGLMYRRRMATDAGMLFVHKREDVVNMWMKNTYIPLDMIFIARDGRIARVAERTVPLSEAVVSSGDPVVAVLELNGGTASRLGIKSGDRVESETLSTVTAQP